MNITIRLTAREAAQILRAHGFDHGWGVHKSQDSQAAHRKLCAAIRAAHDAAQEEAL